MIYKILISLSKRSKKLAKGVLYCSLLALNFSYTHASDQSLPIHFVNANESLKGYELREQSHRFDQLRTGDYGKPEDFDAKVNLFFKETNHPLAIESFPFVVKPIKSSQIEVRLDDTYILNSHDGRLMNHEGLTVLPRTKKNSFALRDFNEFWIDYGPSEDKETCLPRFELDYLATTDRHNKKKKWLKLKSSSQISPSLIQAKAFDYIDFSQDNWKGKDLLYLLNRSIGRSPPDQDWRLSQTEESTIMQRTINVPLKEATQLNLILAPGVRASGVNLVVSSNNSFFSREIIELRQLENTKLADGRTLVRLNMLDALRNFHQSNFSDASAFKTSHDFTRKNFYLKELNIFVPVDSNILKNNDPARGLELLKNSLVDDEYESMPIKLKSNYQSISSSHKRLVVDLRNFNQQNSIFKVKGISLLLYPPIGSNTCGIHIHRLKAVKVQDKGIPVYASLVNEWARQFGEDFNEPILNNHQVNSPGINAYLPFSIFMPSTLHRNQPFILDTLISEPDSIFQKRNSFIQKQNLPLYKVLTEGGEDINPDKFHLTSSGGAVLKFEGKKPEIVLEHNQLLVKGSSKSIAISWPLSTITKENTFFLMQIDEGAKNIDNTNLTLELADGEIVKMHVIPNQPIKLGYGNIDIRKAKLLIKLKDRPSQLNLRHLVFFSPTVKSLNQALTDSLPTKYSFSPQPKFLSNKDSTLQIKPGRIVGKVKDGEEIYFTTAFKPSLKFVQGIKIKYKLPSIFANKNSCGLILNFKWDNGNFSRQLCLLENNKSIFIPISDLFNSEDIVHNFGALKSIDWKFNHPFDTSDSLNEIFDFQFSVVGWALLSAEDQLSYFPLFYKGNSEIFVDTKYVKKISMDDYKSKIVLPLEPDSVPVFFDGNNFIQAVKNSLLTIDELKLEPKKPINDENWRELYYPPYNLWEDFSNTIWLFNFFLISATFGLVFVFYLVLLRLELHFRKFLPILSESLYAKKSSLFFYIALFFGLLIIVFVLFGFKLKLAMYLTNILFVSLLIGLGYEVASLREVCKENKNEKT